MSWLSLAPETMSSDSLCLTLLILPHPSLLKRSITQTCACIMTIILLLLYVTHIKLIALTCSLKMPVDRLRVLKMFLHLRFYLCGFTWRFTTCKSGLVRNLKKFFTKFNITLSLHVQRYAQL